MSKVPLQKIPSKAELALIQPLLEHLIYYENSYALVLLECKLFHYGVELKNLKNISEHSPVCVFSVAL